MAKKPILPNITSQFLSSTQINTAFRAIEESFDNTLSLDGSAPNMMAADLDMNSNDILNIRNLQADSFVVDGVDFTDTLNQALAGLDAAIALIQFTEFTQSSIEYSGDGTTDPLTLPLSVPSSAAVKLYVNGARQTAEKDYTVTDGNKITLLTGSAANFPEGWPVGTRNILVELSRLLDEVYTTNDPQTFATRAEFIAAEIPLSVQRATFIVNGESFSVIRAVGGPIAQTNTQLWKPDGPSTPQHFGATVDGVTDDSAAAQLCLTYVAGLGNGHMHFPEGKYYWEDQISATMSSPVGQGMLKVTGAGTQLTKIILAEANTDGGIKIIGNDNECNVIVHDIGFCSMLNNRVTAERDAPNGTALWITNTLDPDTVGFGSHSNYSVLVERVYVGTDEDLAGPHDRHGSWRNGILIENMWFPVVRNCWVRGLSRINDDTIYDPLTRVEGINERGIAFVDCYSPYAFECTVVGYFDYNAVYDSTVVSGAASEGGVFSGGMLVNGKTALLVRNSKSPVPVLSEPGFHVVDSHINGLTYGIHFKERRQAVIANCYIYPSNATETTALLPSGIWLQDCDDITISGVVTHEKGFYVSNSNAACGIKVTGNSTSININGVQLGHGGIGIYADTAGTIQGSGIYNGGRGPETGLWATRVPLVDVQGTVMLIDNGADETDIGEIRVVSQRTSAGNFPKFKIASQRTDYAADPSVTLGVIPFTGLDSAGAEKNAAQLAAHWDDNTASSEDSKFEAYVLRGGTSSRALRLSGENAQVSTLSTWSIAIGTVTWSAGTGSPEGVVTAPVGSFYSRTNGGAGTSFYVKESGTGNTGWVGK